MKPLCFVLMPFGKKKDENAKEIDFDKIYEEFIKPSIIEADLEPIRADEEIVGGIIHKPMYERLMLCEYAIADLSTANANVFYELGIRHAIRPHSTISIFIDDTKLPFDINFLRALPYNRDLKNLKELQESLIEKLNFAQKNKSVDSPLFQLIDGLKPTKIEHLKTDIFREQVEYNQKIKDKLSQARKEGLNAIKIIEESLGDISNIEAGVVIDLFLSYRSVEAYEELINLVKKMSKPMQNALMIQEQLGFALNRNGQREEAIKVLEKVIDKNGVSSETCGILGRVYKDLWDENKKAGNKAKADGYLKKAIDTYLIGFKADIRDYYPAINAITLMEIAGDKRKNEILPIATYVVKETLNNKPDYWTYATLLELYVLSGDKVKSKEALSDVLIHIREAFEPKTTANNLRLIREVKEARGEEVEWISEIEAILLKNF